MCAYFLILILFLPHLFRLLRNFLPQIVQNVPQKIIHLLIGFDIIAMVMPDAQESFIYSFIEILMDLDWK